MRRREGGRALPIGANAATDLLVCFPSRAHLTLMPKPICSPARPADHLHRHYHHHQRSRGQASPLFRTKPKPAAADISEPTSPKVTCAGQIKIKPKGGACKNWQSVMEEIERLHNHRKAKKKPHWIETLKFKKDIMQFLACLRGLRFDMRCFGSFHGSVLDDDDDSDAGTDDDDEMGARGSDSEASRTIFSKWFMVLQENQSQEKEERRKEESESSAPPPKNALLLMRCRSAPANGWLPPPAAKEGEGEKEKAILGKYESDFFKVSTDIAKETWVVGNSDPFSRSRSWKR